MFSKFLGALAALAFIASPVAASDLGPAVGAPIPHDLSLVDADGVDRTFDGLVGEKGMALFFVRSLDWCPYCKAQARDAGARFDDFAARGLSVVIVSYDAPEKLKAFAGKDGAFKPVALSDADIEAINAFGIRNEEHQEGSRFYGIPHPVVFIVDREKTIRAKFFEADFTENAKSYQNRPAIELILDGADAAFSE